MGRFTCSMTQALLMALTIQMNHKATLRKFVHSCLADLKICKCLLPKNYSRWQTAKII